MLTDIALMREVASHLAGVPISIKKSNVPIDKYLQRVAEIKLTRLENKQIVPFGTKAFIKVTKDNKPYLATKMVTGWMCQAKKVAGTNASDNELLKALRTWEDR